MEQEPNSNCETGSERGNRCGRFVPPAVRRLAGAMVPPEPILSAMKPPMTRLAWLRFFLTHLPILHWVWTYKLRYLIPDIIAGLTVGVMHIPQGLAYGLLTGLDPVYGLYTSFVPVIMYSIFGTSRQLSTGTFAVICLMVGNSINQVFTDKGLDFCRDEANIGVIINGTNTTCGDMEVEVAVSLALTAGIIMTIMGCFQMGFVTIFLSEPLISGYTTGAALLVCTTQLPHIFGATFKIRPVISYFPDVVGLPRIWLEAARQIVHWPQYVNTAAFVITLCSVILMVILGLINQKVVSRLKVCCCALTEEKKCHVVAGKFKWPLLIPIPLVLVFVGTVFSAGINFEERFNVSIVGYIPASFPPVTIPNGHYMVVTMTNAFVIAIVTCAINTSLVQLYSKKHGYPTNTNQEFIAYGIANIVGAFFSSFSSVASLARTAVQNDSGGKTQLVGLISSLVVGIVLVSLSFLFYSLPKAVLAAIICGSMYGMLKQVADLKKYFKVSYSDALVWLVVFFATVLLGMDLGLALGVLFSLFIVVFKAALPNYNVSRPTDKDWRYDTCSRQKDVTIFQFSAPLCFVNVGVFRTRLIMAAHLDQDSLHSDDGGCIQNAVQKWRQSHQYRGLERNTEGSDGAQSKSDEESGLVSTIIIDCSPIGYLDTVGTEALLHVIMDLDLKGIQVILASLSVPNLRVLQRSNFFVHCGNEWIFSSVQDAVEHSINGRWLRPQQANAKLNTIEMEKLQAQQEHISDSVVNADVRVDVDIRTAEPKEQATTSL